MNNTRILIVGYGRAGKDTAGMMLSKITGIPYCGSTSWAAKELVAEYLGLHPQVAWETRHQRREDWKRICDKLRQENQVRLIQEALNWRKEYGYRSRGGIVVGIRDRIELFAAIEQDIFDMILWIENPRVPQDPTVTFTRDEVFSAGGFVIHNDKGLDDLQWQLFHWADEKGLIPRLYLSGKCPTSDIHRE